MDCACADYTSSLEEIEEKRRRLDDLLYDFEDYTDPDTFEPDRYTDLQAATRSLALHVIDVIKRMKVDAPMSPLSLGTPPVKAMFPPLPPLPPLPSTRPSSRASTQTGGHSGPRATTPVTRREGSMQSRSPPPSMPPSPDRKVPRRHAKGAPSASSSLSESSEPAVHHLRLPPGKRGLGLDRTSNSQHGLLRSDTIRSQVSNTASVDSLPPYTASGEAMPLMPGPSLSHRNAIVSPAHTPTLANHPPISRGSSPEILGAQAAQVHIVNPDNFPRPPSPTETEGSIGDIPNFPMPRHGTRITAWVSDQAASTAVPASRFQRPASRIEPHSLQAIQGLRQMTIPEDKVVGPGQDKVDRHPSINFDSPLSPMLAQLAKFSIDPSTMSASSSFVDLMNSPETSRTSPMSQSAELTSFRSRTGGPPGKISDATESSNNIPPQPSTPTPLVPMSLPAAAIGMNIEHGSDGLILATPSEEWATRTVLSDRASTLNGSGITSASAPREADVAIGPRSSLYALKGFCNGAQGFKSGGHEHGVKKIAGYVAGISTHTARCATCSYGHAWSEMELDLGRDPRATFPRDGGVLFRIRMLYKCHLVASRTSEAFYGCLFCATAGSVVREGDATVFQNSDDLFRHLARHPQPLPEVEGVTVLYGKDVLASDPRVHDFDLWLTEASSPGGVPAEVSGEVAKLPTALGAKTHVQRYGEKKLARPDGMKQDDVLRFFVGARVIGVEFPGRQQGKWATGWHDGRWGYFPAKAVELEKPKPGKCDNPPLLHGIGGSGVSVRARWRFDPGASIRDAAEKGWLAFDKGEKLTNVGWPPSPAEGGGGGLGREGWCWSGTNSKGRFGVFPRSHVDEGSLREEARPPGSGSGGQGGGGGKREKKKEGGGRSGGSKFGFGVRRRASGASSSGSGIIEII